MRNYDKLILTGGVTAFLMLVVLIGITKEQGQVSCAAVGAIMTVMTAFLWKRENGGKG